MFNELVNRWWIVALRGAVAMAFGLAAWLAPAITLTVLVSLFGVFAIADGVFAMGAGLSTNWLPMFLDGVVGAGLGLAMIFCPPMAQAWFIALLIAAWAVVTGLIELYGAAALGKVVNGVTHEGQRLLAVSGGVSLLFGIGLTFAPIHTAAAFVWLLGSYAVASGAVLVALGFNVRHWPHAASVSGLRAQV